MPPVVVVEAVEEEVEEVEVEVMVDVIGGGGSVDDGTVFWVTGAPVALGAAVRADLPLILLASG